MIAISPRTLTFTFLICLCSITPAQAQYEPFVAVRATPYTQCGPNGCRIIRPAQIVPRLRLPQPVNPSHGRGQLLCNGVVIQAGVGKSGQTGIWVLTVAHLFRSARDPEVRVQSRWSPAELIGADHPRDLALLWVPAVNSPSIKIATEDPTPGTAVTLHVYDHLGAGQFLEPSAPITMPPISTTGIRRWQWNRGVRQGWSGGAFTHNGQLIGIQSAGDASSGIVVQRESILKFLQSQSAAPPSIPESNEAELEGSYSEPPARRVITEVLSNEIKKAPAKSKQINETPLVKHIKGAAEELAQGWTWVKVAAYFGGPLGVAIGAAGWLVNRRRRVVTTTEHRPVMVETPPPKQVIDQAVRYTPVESDLTAEAFAWAQQEYGRRYPGSIGTVETLKSMMDQYICGRRANKGA